MSCWDAKPGLACGDLVLRHWVPQGMLVRKWVAGRGVETWSWVILRFVWEIFCLVYLSHRPQISESRHDLPARIAEVVGVGREVRMREADLKDKVVGTEVTVSNGLLAQSMLDVFD